MSPHACAVLLGEIIHSLRVFEWRLEMPCVQLGSLRLHDDGTLHPAVLGGRRSV